MTFFELSYLLLAAFLGVALSFLILGAFGGIKKWENRRHMSRL